MFAYERHILRTHIRVISLMMICQCRGVMHHFIPYVLQNPAPEMNKYQTLPGKRSRKCELTAELNGDAEADTEYLSPVQLSVVHNQDQDYSLSECLHH